VTVFDAGLLVVAVCRVRGCTCQPIIVVLAPVIDDDLTAGTFPFRVQHEPDCAGYDRQR